MAGVGGLAKSKMNINVMWLLVLPVLVLVTWTAATLTMTSTATNFRIKASAPTWNRVSGKGLQRGFVGHTAIKHLVSIHYPDEKKASLEYCDTESMPFPYASIKYDTSYNNYNSSFKMMLHHPESDFSISGSLFNSGGLFEWKSHLKNIMTYFLDEMRTNGVKDPLVVDIGANIGTNALWLASLGYRVHAFEPTVRNFALLHCSYVLNPKLHTRMWLSNVGLSDREQSGVCMKYNDGSKGEAWIRTGWMDIPYEMYDDDYSAVADEAEPGAGGRRRSSRRLLQSNQESLEELEKELEREEELELEEELEAREEEAFEKELEEELELEIEEEMREGIEGGKADHEDSSAAVEAEEKFLAGGWDEEDLDEFEFYSEMFEYYDWEEECDESDVNLITLDWYWENKLNSEEVSLLKIDVEGFEDKVLKGGRRMFQEAPPKYVLMEMHPHGQKSYKGDPKTLYHEIRDLGYHIIAVDGKEIDETGWLELVNKGAQVFDTLWVRSLPDSGFDWAFAYYAYGEDAGATEEFEEKPQGEAGADMAVAEVEVDVPETEEEAEQQAAAEAAAEAAKEEGEEGGKK